MMLKIGHFSDLHGKLERLNTAFYLKPDIWVSTGDLLPNCSDGVEIMEEHFQPAWLKKNLEFFKRLFGDTPVLFVNGNHDYISPEEIWREAGINAIPVEKTKKEILGFSFAGFPEINYIAGVWRYETHPDELANIANAALAQRPDLLITHSPPKHIMDGMFNSYGIPALEDGLMQDAPGVLVHLYGHCHGCGGTMTRRSIIFSNAATQVNYIEVEK